MAMDNTRVRGQVAFMRDTTERGLFNEVKDEVNRLHHEEGLTYPDAWRRIINDPRFAPPVDMEEEDVILELDKIVKSEEGCALDRSVAWVAENIGNDRARVQDAPGKGTAWNLLEWVRESPTNKSEFIKSLLCRLMPSSKDLENQARYSDDGSKQIELAERILARITENGT